MLLTRVIFYQGIRLKLLMQSDEQIKSFLLKPLKSHNLPTRIYHTLPSDYCLKMEDVAEKGEHGPMRMLGIGKDSNLFMENGCGSLFI